MTTPVPVYTVGDLERPLSGQLKDGTTPLDVTTALSVRVDIWRPKSHTKISRAPVFVDAMLGTWKLAWQVGDLTETGDHQVQVQVTWPGNRPQTFGPQIFRVRGQIA